MSTLRWCSFLISPPRIVVFPAMQAARNAASHSGFEESRGYPTNSPKLTLCAAAESTHRRDGQSAGNFVLSLPNGSARAGTLAASRRNVPPSSGVSFCGAVVRLGSYSYDCFDGVQLLPGRGQPMWR